MVPPSPQYQGRPGSVPFAGRRLFPWWRREAGGPLKQSKSRETCRESGTACLIGTESLEGGQGRLAQLVERLVYTEDVGGSSPSLPTIFNPYWVCSYEPAAGWRLE